MDGPRIKVSAAEDDVVDLIGGPVVEKAVVEFRFSVLRAEGNAEGFFPAIPETRACSLDADAGILLES